MSEIEYSQLAGHITEKLDNTAEYEDWLTIQDYIEQLQSNLTKEQLAYINLRDTFNKLQQERQELKEQLINNSKINVADHKYASNCEDKIIKLENQLKQRDEVIDEAIDTINKMLTVGYTKGLALYCALDKDSQFGCRALIIKDILNKYKGVDD